MDKVLLKYTEYDQPHESQTNNDIVETIHRLVAIHANTSTLASLSGKVLLDLTVLTSMIPILETSETTAVQDWG